MPKHFATILLFATLSTLICSCNKLEMSDVQIDYTKCSDIPVARASAATAVVGAYGYVLCGRDENGNYLNDFWQYDAANDTWTQLPDAPFTARVKPVAIAIDSTIYCGLGFNGKIYTGNSYLKDWWKYDVGTKTWTQLAKFPSDNTDGAIAFVCAEQIFVMYGSNSGFSKPIYVYNIAQNTWQTLANDQKPRATSAFGMVGEQAHGRCFVGTGYNTENLNQWYEYVPSNNTFAKRTKIPTKGREQAVVTSWQNKVFVIGGRHFGGSLTDGFLFDDILQYDIETDAWYQIGTIPNGGRENAVAFTIGNTCYFGMGENTQGDVLSDLYSWEN